VLLTADRRRQAGAAVSDERGKVHFGIARVDLHLPGVDSLKGRRALLNRARASLASELGCSVTEVGDVERWQRASLGVAVAASTQTGVDRVLDRVTAVVERDPRVVVLGIADLADALDADEPARPPTLP
jgi:uncharacterized protein YlxP (DUF503 family)